MKQLQQMLSAAASKSQAMEVPDGSASTSNSDRRKRKTLRLASSPTRARRTAFVQSPSEEEVEPEASAAMPPAIPPANLTRQPAVFQNLSLSRFLLGLPDEAYRAEGLEPALLPHAECTVRAALHLSCFSSAWTLLYDPADLAVPWLQSCLDAGKSKERAGEPETSLGRLAPQAFRHIKYTSATWRSDLKVAIAMGKRKRGAAAWAGLHPVVAVNVYFWARAACGQELGWR